MVDGEPAHPEVKLTAATSKVVAVSGRRCTDR
jgi:hypothetical protein